MLYGIACRRAFSVQLLRSQYIRIEATVEAFTALQRGLDGERRAMERIWKERETQIDRVLANAGMYGEVRGILGTTVPPVAALELEAVAGNRCEGEIFAIC